MHENTNSFQDDFSKEVLDHFFKTGDLRFPGYYDSGDSKELEKFKKILGIIDDLLILNDFNFIDYRDYIDVNMDRNVKTYYSGRLYVCEKTISLENIKKAEDTCHFVYNHFLSNDLMKFWSKKVHRELIVPIKEKYLSSLKTNCQRLRRREFQSRRNQLLLELFARDTALCSSCRTTEKLQIDHILALSKGGSDELENLQILCRSCNASKGCR